MQYQLENLKVWQVGLRFVTRIYEVTKDFPKEEQYGLTGQMRRAAVSVPSNIAEGKGRGHRKEYVQFLYVAKGSALELMTLIHVAKNLEYLSIEVARELLEDLCEMTAMLQGLIKTLQQVSPSPFGLLPSSFLLAALRCGEKEFTTGYKTLRL